MLVEMKEQRAKIVNECLAGKLTQNEIEEQFRGNFDQEEAKLGQIIKPEYFRQPKRDNIELPDKVAWKKCAHQPETTCLTYNREGNILYTGGGDGIVKSWNVANGKCMGEM